jgi:membrane protein
VPTWGYTRVVAKNGKPHSPVADVLAPAAAFVVMTAAVAHRTHHDAPSERTRSTADGELSDRRAGDAPAKGVKGRLYAAGERFRPLGVGLKLNDRFGEVHGNSLAGSITLQSFLSLFPLLLLAISVAGFVVGHDPRLATDIVGKLGLTGQAAQAFSTALTRAAETKGTTLSLGTIGLLWSGLGLVGSIQFAYNQSWQVQARGVKDKLFGLAWLAGATVLLVVSAGVTTMLGWLPGVFWPLGIVVTLAIDIGFWLWMAKMLPNRDVGWRPLVPGALLGAVGLEVLKFVGRFYVPHLVATSSAVYGSIGVVFAILAWLFFFGRLIVYSACLNVVLYEERHGTVEAKIEVPRTPQARPAATRASQARPAAAAPSPQTA